MSRDPETSAPSSPRTAAPSRRTILTGAAWSVPVIAAASIAPVASASGVTALAFNQSSYSGTACGTITGAYVTVTVDGVAAAGKSVTTTLGGGYTFAGGATTDTQVSGSNGRVNLPAITVPSVGGSGTLSALSGSATSSATASAPAIRAVGLQSNNTYFPAIPAGVTARAVGVNASGNVYTGYFLGSDGYLYKSYPNGAGWTIVSLAGVTDFSLDTSGAAAIYTTGTTVGLDWSSTYFQPLPAGVTARSVQVSTAGGYSAYFLGSDGYLYKSYAGLNSGAWTKVSLAGVTDFSLDTSGAAAIYTTGTTVGLDWSSTYFQPLPTGVTARSVQVSTAGGYSAYFLGSDGYLYKSYAGLNSGAWTKVSLAGVTDFSLDTTGAAAIYTTGTTVGLDWSSTYFPPLPTGVTARSVGLSTASGYTAYFLGSDGYLYTSKNAGAWTAKSPAGVTDFSLDTVGSDAIYALNGSGC